MPRPEMTCYIWLLMSDDPPPLPNDQLWLARAPCLSPFLVVSPSKQPTKLPGREAQSTENDGRHLFLEVP